MKICSCLTPLCDFTFWKSCCTTGEQDHASSVDLLATFSLHQLRIALRTSKCLQVIPTDDVTKPLGWNCSQKNTIWKWFALKQFTCFDIILCWIDQYSCFNRGKGISQAWFVTNSLLQQVQVLHNQNVHVSSLADVCCDVVRARRVDATSQASSKNGCSAEMFTSIYKVLQCLPVKIDATLWE